MLGKNSVCILLVDAYRPPQSPFYQLPPNSHHYPSNQLLLSPTPPGLQQLLGEFIVVFRHVVNTSHCSAWNTELALWFADNIKVQYLQFMAHMKTPQYRSNLQQLLEQEKVRAVISDVIMHNVMLPLWSPFHLHFLSTLFLNAAKAQGLVRAGGAAPLRLSGSQRQDQRSLSGQAGRGEICCFMVLLDQSTLCVCVSDYIKKMHNLLSSIGLCSFVITF